MERRGRESRETPEEKKADSDDTVMTGLTDEMAEQKALLMTLDSFKNSGRSSKRSLLVTPGHTFTL